MFLLYLLQEIQKFKEGEEKMKKDLAESEKKINQYKMVLVKGQNKIRDQQAQIEKLGKENAELKEKSTAGGPSKGIFFRLTRNSLIWSAHVHVFLLNVQILTF